MARLTDDFGSPSSLAAAEKLAVRATASKTASRLRSVIVAPLERSCARHVIARVTERRHIPPAARRAAPRPPRSPGEPNDEEDARDLAPRPPRPRPRGAS